MAREKGQIGRSLARYVRAAAGDTATETNARQGRRLPVTETTAAVITGQQQRVRHRFPDTSVSRLVLLPTVIGNPDGSRPVSVQSLIQRHHDWIGRMPALALADGREFDKATISPYCYRHT